MKNFTHAEVEKRFFQVNPSGTINFITEYVKASTKRCIVQFNPNGKEYKYNYNSPIDLMRSLKLANEAELLNARGLKQCKCGSGEVIQENEIECNKCTSKPNPFSFLIN